LRSQQVFHIQKIKANLKHTFMTQNSYSACRIY
jgi:hypothetical protein